MDRARDDYTREERSKLEELERNKRRQRELEDELRMLKARENQLRDEVAEGKELQQKVDEVRRVRRREDGQVGVGGGEGESLEEEVRGEEEEEEEKRRRRRGGGEEEEEKRRRREGIYVSTVNSACMPKCRPKCTQCFAFEMLQKFILKHLVCKYSVLACSHVHVYSLDLSGVHK